MSAGKKDASHLKPHQFRKGQTGNVRGASARTRELAAIKRLTVEEVAEIGSFMLSENYEALRAVRADKNASVLKVWLASLIMRSMARGDYGCWEVVMSRIIGKPVAEGYTRAVQEAEDQGDGQDRDSW